MIWTLSPLLLLKAAFLEFASPRKTNLLNNDEPVTGRKNGAFSQELSLVKIKTLAKRLECTHNDFMTVLLSQTL